MKYKLFDDEGKIELTEISTTLRIPSFFGEKVEPNTIDEPVVKTRVFTDGVVVKEETPETEEIKEYFINGKKYIHKVDKKTTKTIYLKNRKDISALRKARKAMRRIEEGNNSVNYDNLFQMLLTSNQNKRNMEFEQIKDNVYTLKK